MAFGGMTLKEWAEMTLRHMEFMEQVLQNEFGWYFYGDIKEDAIMNENNEERIELEIQRIVSQVVMHDYPDIYGPNLKTQYFPMLENYIGEGIRHIYRMAVKEELEAQYPSDWKQSFKERWFPKWLIKRYPIKYTQIIAKHKFPQWQRDLGKEYVSLYHRRTS